MNRNYKYFVPMLVAIGSWAFVFLREKLDAGSQAYFHWANGVFLLSVLVILILEYKFLQLRQRSIRQIGMWLLLYSAAYIRIIQTNLFSTHTIIGASALVAVSIVPIVILMTIFGNQPRVVEGRFTPIVLVILSGFWNIHYFIRLY